MPFCMFEDYIVWYYDSSLVTLVLSFCIQGIRVSKTNNNNPPEKISVTAAKLNID